MSCLLFVGGCNFVTLGWFIPVFRVDRLDEPVPVKSWNENGLKLADGRTVMPLGMTRLPAKSLLLRTATLHGVEVAPNGRVYGLIRIAHTCGNDPVQFDLRKLDLARLLAYHREGKSTVKPGTYAQQAFREFKGGWGDLSGMRMAFNPQMKDFFAERERILAERNQKDSLSRT